MANIRSIEPFAVAMTKALGLERCTKLVITLEAGSVPLVEATIIPDDAAMDAVLRKFTLTTTPVLESADGATEAGT